MATIAARVPALRLPRVRWKALVGALLAGLVVLYLILSAYVTSLAVSAHRTPVMGTPTDLGLQYEAVSFLSDVDHIPIDGWLLPAPSDRAVIMLHGLDGNRWIRPNGSPHLSEFLVDAGYNVLLFDFRGHGQSGSGPLGLGWYERRDVRGAVTFLESRGFQPGRIDIHGGSYGAATALLSTAAIPEVAAVVADSPFADARDLLNREIRRRTGLPEIFGPGVTFFGSAEYGLDLNAIPPLKAMPAIAPRPILLMHGTADQRIPYEHSERLLAASAPGTADLWLVEGVGHTRAFYQYTDQYVARVIQFFDRQLPR